MFKKENYPKLIKFIKSIGLFPIPPRNKDIPRPLLLVTGRLGWLGGVNMVKKMLGVSKECTKMSIYLKHAVIRWYGAGFKSF